jgi:hypothetical protein
MIRYTSFDADIGVRGAATCPGCGRPARLRGRHGHSDVYTCEGDGCHLLFEVLILDRRPQRQRATGYDPGGPSDVSCAGPVARADESIPVGRVGLIRSHDELTT